MRIGEYLRRLMTRKESYKYINKPYERSKCDICGQICYNKEDLQIHLKYNHPDVQSAAA
jgi:hypothetical protein